MKKTKAGAAAGAILAGALAASMLAVPAAMAESTVVTADGGTADTLLYTDTDSNGDGNADVISQSWTVTIPDKVALVKEGNDGLPGDYSGTATVAYKGQIGTAQHLTVTPDAEVTMKDANGWSSDVTVSSTPSGLSNLSYADVYNNGTGGNGTTAFTGTFGAGKWTGTCTFTVACK